jgi:cytosine/adenosine deaminase-related metal-dependent hydrolase
MATLIQNARIHTFDAHRTVHECADILVEGQTITCIGSNLDVKGVADLEIVDGSGKLVIPGLINAHLHSPANHLKGALKDAPLEMFMLYEVPPISRDTDGGRFNYLRTMIGAIEMLRLGITAVHDDAFHNPLPTRASIDAIMNAYADAGMRATVTIDQPNVAEYDKFPYLKGLLPEHLIAEMRDTPRQSSDELMALYEDYVERWHGKAKGRLRCAVSCSAPQRATTQYMQALSAFARKHDLPFNIHILETRLQRVLGHENYGKSLIQHVKDIGILDEYLYIIHSIWVDEQDIADMAQSGCTISHNPISNLKIGSGVMPFRKLRDAGIPIALGTDEAAVDDTSNVWGVAKMVGLIHKITDPDWDRWPTAPEILDCLFKGGARSMRLQNSIGQISPGFQADLVMLDLNSMAFTPLNDVERQLVFTENGSSVVLTMVAGTQVYRDGKLLLVDEEALKAEFRIAAAEHASRFSEVHENAQRVAPYYDAMLRKAYQQPVEMQRWLPSAD